MKDEGEDISVDVDPGIRELLPVYVERRKADIPRLRDALNRRDFAAIRVIGHNLHGSGAAYGLDRITEIGAALESAAAARDADAAGSAIDALENFVGRVRLR